MEGTYDALRRHAEKDLAAIRQRLDSGRRMSVRETHQLADVAEKLTRTMDNMDRLENRRPYADTSIGYRTTSRRHDRTSDNVTDAIQSAMDVVDRILPHLDMDDYDNAEMRRGRPRTTRRGVGRYTQVRRHVRRMPRGDMDDRYDMDDDDYRYDMDDDDRYAVDDRRGGRRRRDSRGRFMQSAMDDMRYEDARYAERRMEDNRRARGDHTRQTSNAAPVMARSDHDERSDRDERDDAHRPGPDMRR